MNTYSIIEIFTLLFATMGPIKVLITIIEKTQDLDKAVKHRIVINAVWVAAVVGLVFIFFGFIFMEIFKFSTVAMSLAGGVILLVYAVKSILKEPKTGEKKGYATDREAEKMVVYPLAIPLMASPMGLVTLLSVDFITKYLSAETLEVANRILGR